MPFPRDHKITAEEFFKLTPDNDSERYELINGEVFAQAAPSTSHQRITGGIYRKIGNYIESNSGKCESFISPFDVKLDDDTVVQPDVLVVCDPSQIDDMRCNGAPDLIIEVTSSNYGHDYVEKLALYKKYGVREYWIVDPLYKRVMVYFFEKSDFPSIYTFDTAVPVEIYEGKLLLNIEEFI
ncbi:MAG: Uma2 family endonuclease [Ruminococcus sp.]|nr:Uma2 family endonuclease [Ruminococcus sp.]